jgi:predicted dehydrogenase
MTVAEPVALGLVGCGRLAEAGYLPAAARTSAVRIVAVADPDAARRNLVAELAATPSFADTATLLENVAVDALILATPAHAHYDDAALAVSRRVAVLVEKPPAPDATGAAALAALQPPPFIGFNRRFAEGIRVVREQASRVSDTRLTIELAYRRGAWGAVTVPDDALTDLGPHVIDLARWITNSDVHAVTRADVHAERATFELILGRGHARISIATDRVHHELVEVHSAGGRVLGYYEIGGFVAGVHGRLRRSRHDSALVMTLAAQLDALADAARGATTTALGTARDGWTVMETIDSVRASDARGGRPAAVRSVPSLGEVE